MELIDLGMERSSGLPVEPDDPPKPRRWLPVLAWLPVLVLAAAAPPAEPGMSIVADITLGSGQLSDFVGDAIVIVNRELLAVHEVDGTLRWQAEVGLSNGAIVQGSGENRIVTSFRGGPLSGRTSAFNLADGTRLWTFEGNVQVLDDMIVVRANTEVSGYDRSGQRRLWQVTDVVSHNVDVRGNAVLTLTKQGELAERDLHTGVVRRSAKPDLPPSASNHLSFSETDIVVYSRTVEGTQDVAFTIDRDTLTIKGSGRHLMPAASSPIRYDCGPVLCEMGRYNGGVSILDRDSGVELWRTDGDHGIVPTAAGLVEWATYASGNDAGPMWLVSPRTGKRLAEYVGWQKIVDFGPGRLDMAPVMIRPNYVAEPERTHLAAFNRNGLKILGSLPRILSNCRYVNNFLACHSGDGRLIVMRLYPERW